jgi:hypothetical protein
MHITPPTSTSSGQSMGIDHKQSPAKMVREQLATRTDLTEQPFGNLVSLISRGLELPPAITAPSSTDGAVPSNSSATNSTGATA